MMKKLSKNNPCLNPNEIFFAPEGLNYFRRNPVITLTTSTSTGSYIASLNTFMIAIIFFGLGALIF